MPAFDHAHYATLWARQLQKEFEDICWSHQIRLEIPLFEIFDSNRRLGEWSEKTRTIGISTELILYHSWTVTINVLKHEMAHQLCSVQGLAETGHGPHFQEACLKLGVPPAYRSARGDSPELFADLNSECQMIQDGRRFFAKVEKLLALSRSANEYEAALAMQKANELIVKYNIEQMASDAERSYRHLVINSGLKRIHGWQRAIAIILQDFFYVRIVLAKTYDPLLNEHYKTIDLFGRSENVAVAEYCYHFLVRELDFLWESHKSRSGGRGITEKHSYYLGVLNGFTQTLQRQQNSCRPTIQGSRAATAHQCLPATTCALAVAADHHLDDFVALLYPRLQKKSHTGSRINRSTYDHGRADGKNIVLHKGVTHHDGNQGRLLPC